MCNWALGSRSALLNMDARGVGSLMLNRKCVLVKWTDLSIEVFTDVLERGAGAVLILLPTDWSTLDNQTALVSSIFVIVDTCMYVDFCVIYM